MIIGGADGVFFCFVERKLSEIRRITFPAQILPEPVGRRGGWLEQLNCPSQAPGIATSIYRVLIGITQTKGSIAH